MMLLPPPLQNYARTGRQGNQVTSFWRTKKPTFYSRDATKLEMIIFQVLPCFPPSFILLLLFYLPWQLDVFCVYSVFHVKFSKGAVMGKRGYVSVVGKLLFIYLFSMTFLFFTFLPPLFLYSLFSLISTGLYESTLFTAFYFLLFFLLCDWPIHSFLPCWYSKRNGWVWYNRSRTTCVWCE